jgi:GT2 family glycosyltransferase
MKSVCLAILNYNGRKHLEHLLPTAGIAAKNFQGACAVLVLDNRSSEPDVEWIRREFPSIEVEVAPRNDFLFSYNWLAQKRTEDIIVILNNDLKLFPDFVQPLARHFDFADVFAVTATSRDWDDQVFTCGPARLQSHHGFYHWDYERDRQELSHTLYCSGGFMAVDRKKFLELGGFNRLFWPGYAEDLDLGFRAWRRGWRSIFEPASVVLHRENGSWGGEGGNRVARLCLRTALLFQWASLPAAASWPERAVFFILTLARKLRQGQSWWLRVWLATWMEWRRQRKDYLAMKTPSDELAKILAAMNQAVTARGS